MYAAIAQSLAREISQRLGYSIYSQPESFCDNEWTLWFKQPELPTDWKHYLYIEERATQKSITPFTWMKRVCRFVFYEYYIKADVTHMSSAYLHSEKIALVPLYDPDCIDKIIEFLMPWIHFRIDPEWPSTRDSTIMVFLQDAWEATPDRTGG